MAQDTNTDEASTIDSAIEICTNHIDRHHRSATMVLFALVVGLVALATLGGSYGMLEARSRDEDRGEELLDLVFLQNEVVDSENTIQFLQNQLAEAQAELDQSPLVIEEGQDADVLAEIQGSVAGYEQRVVNAQSSQEQLIQESEAALVEYNAWQPDFLFSDAVIYGFGLIVIILTSVLTSLYRFQRPFIFIRVPSDRDSHCRETVNSVAIAAYAGVVQW